MPAFEMSEERRVLREEMDGNTYAVAAQATILAAIERYFILSLIDLCWCLRGRR